jgi:tetratricopeptide (TPR) repeat protein
VAERFRVFISSPGDVLPERALAGQVIERLAREFSYFMDVDPVFWEREPLTADAPFQDNITPPHDTDAVVVIIWSRLGTELPPEQYQGAVSGQAVTGTEWEFEDALHAAQENGRPDLLLYVKRAPVSLPTDDREARKEQEAQLDLVENFMSRWVRDSSGGSFMAAFHEFRELAAFEEMLENHLRGLIRKRLDPAAQTGEPPSRRWFDRPYRGLEPFLIDHAPIFHGRTWARNDLREALAGQSAAGCGFLLVLGASGSGKSSLVQAGLVADLRVPGMMPSVGLCRYAVMRPMGLGPDLVAGIAEVLLSDTALPELADLKYDAGRLAAIIGESPAQLAIAMEQGLAEAGKRAHLTDRAEARLALVVDQLEEIFTREDVTDEQRRTFVAALGALARTGLVWVIATMRSDFLDQLNEAPELVELSQGGGRFLLPPPSEGELGQIVRLPAREAGLRFETDAETGLSLDEEILAAAAGQPSALPLLEYLLDQLWQKRSEDGCLTFAAYREIGGLEGALGQRAEQIYETELSDRAREAFPRVLRALVTAGEGSDTVATARTVPLDDFAAGTPAREVVDAYLAPDARLLIAEGDSEVGGGARIRVAHEALLTHWPRAKEQIALDWRDIQTRASLERSEARWREATRKDRNSLLLPSGLPLAEAEDLMVRQGEEVSSDLNAFVAASRRRARRRIHLLQVAAAAMFILAVIAGTGGYLALHREQVAQKNFLVAIDTADGLVSQLSKEIRADLRMPASKIKEAMAHADSAFKRLMEEAGASDDILHRYARLTKVFAESHYLLGEGEKSAELAKKAIEAIGRLNARRTLKSRFDLTGAEAHVVLGEAYLELKRDEEARKAFDAASKMAAPWTHSTEDVSDWAKVRYRTRLGTGNALRKKQRKDAKNLIWQASNLAQRMSEKFPKDPEWLHYFSNSRFTYGMVNRELRLRADAKKAFDEAISSAERLTEKFPESLRWKHDLLVARWALGSIYYDWRRYDVALKEFQIALGLAEVQTRGNSDIARWQMNHSLAHFWVALAHIKLGSQYQARDALEQSLKIARRLAARNPKNKTWARQVYDVRFKQGELYENWAFTKIMGVRAEALKAYQEAQEIALRLARSDPKSRDFVSIKYFATLNVGDAHKVIGDIKAERRRTKEARKDYLRARTEYRKAVAIAEEMLAAGGNAKQWQRNRFDTSVRLAKTLTARGEFSQLLAAYRRNAKTLDGFIKTAPGDHRLHQWYWEMREHLGGRHKALGKNADAIKLHKENGNRMLSLIKQHPKHLRYRENLSHSYEKLGDLHDKTKLPMRALSYYRFALHRWFSVKRRDPSTRWIKTLEAKRKKVRDQIRKLGTNKRAAAGIGLARTALNKYTSPDFEKAYASQRRQWDMPPLFRGPWYNLARRDWWPVRKPMQSLLRKVRFGSTEVTQIRAMPLPFYEDLVLYEVKVKDAPGIYTFIRYPERVQFLQTLTNQDRALNERNKILLDTAGQVAAYVRFFVGGRVLRKSGRLTTLIDDVMDLPWSTDPKDAALQAKLQACLRRLVKPMLVEPTPRGSWRVIANTKFGSSVFSTVLEIRRNGFVETPKITSLASGIPFVQERLVKGARLRIAGKRESTGKSVRGCADLRKKPSKGQSAAPKRRSALPATGNRKPKPRPERRPDRSTNPFAR